MSAAADRQIGDNLPALVERASQRLSEAKTAAEVLEARDVAGMVYDAAKRAARLAQAKGAHDDIVARIHRTQADALEIEAGAKRRLADEYDAAQERGEAKANGGDRTVPKENSAPSAADLGFSRKDIHEARRLRDAEKAQPGVTRAALDAALKDGREPTKAVVRRAVESVPRESESMRKPRKLGHLGKNPERIERLRLEAKIWGQLRDAVTALAGLPLPADVAVIASKLARDKRAIIDSNLSSALKWLKGFHDAWSNGDEAHAKEEQDRNGHPDAGDGDRAPGAQPTQSTAA